ncbi:MAG TPA: ROK family protein [Acholeplasmataceae bacterium]|nr:ROK family protein [Acholeplasmataceae bacterium]
MMNCIFGIDIGGTEIKIGKFHYDKLLLKTSIKTDVSDQGKRILADVFNKIDELSQGDNIVGIGVGVPGPVVKGVVNGCQNLGWGIVEAEAIIKERYPDARVRVLNDANVAAIGEMAAGSAQKYRDFVMVTLGTGIGGGIVINGEVYEGATGAGGEIGHIQILNAKQRRCNCGKFDCFEKYASATGLVTTALELMQGRETKLHDLEVSSKNIFDLAKTGDEVALAAVNQMVDVLAGTLGNIAAALNPEAFVIGGGVSKAGSFLLDKLVAKFREVAFYPVADTEFVLASLGNDAGIYGAAYVARK